EKTEQLKRLEQSTAFTYPMQLVREKSQRIDKLTNQVTANIKEKLYVKERNYTQLVQRLEKQHPKDYLTLSSQNISFLQAKFQTKLREAMSHKRHELSLSIEKLTLLNPLHIMQRGYSVTYSETD